MGKIINFINEQKQTRSPNFCPPLSSYIHTLCIERCSFVSCNVKDRWIEKEMKTVTLELCSAVMATEIISGNTKAVIALQSRVQACMLASTT